MHFHNGILRWSSSVGEVSCISSNIFSDLYEPHVFLLVVAVRKEFQVDELLVVINYYQGLFDTYHFLQRFQPPPKGEVCLISSHVTTAWSDPTSAPFP